MIFRLWMEDPLHTTAPARLTPLIVGVTALGSAPVVLLAVLVGAGLLMARHATRQLKALLGVSVLTEALNLLLKSLIHRQRPHLWAGLWSLTDYSFPSGHSMAAMAIYGLLAYLLSLYYPREAWLIKLGAAGLILAIGASRMLMGVHWPTDVLGGYAAGACVLCAGVLVRGAYRSHRPPEAPRERARRRLMPTPPPTLMELMF